MGNRLNKPYMEVEGNQTTGRTSIDAQTTGGTDRQTFFLLLFWGCGSLIRPQKKSELDRKK